MVAAGVRMVGIRVVRVVLCVRNEDILPGEQAARAKKAMRRDQTYGRLIVKRGHREILNVVIKSVNLSLEERAMERGCLALYIHYAMISHYYIQTRV
jgi:hypothetical protein